MGKKLIYLLILLFIGGFIVMQSCNESPIVSNAPDSPLILENGLVKTDGELRTFVGWDAAGGKPILCGSSTCTSPCGTNKLEIVVGEDMCGGYVEFINLVGNTLTVKLTFVSPSVFPWDIGYVSMHVQDNMTGFPGQPGGHTTYPPTFVNSTNTEYTFSITLPPDDNNDGCYYMALHTEQDLYGGTEGFEFYLPDGLIDYTVNYNSPTSYFKSTFTDAGFLTGMTLESYCIDPDVYMNPAGGLELQGYIYSSYETLPGYINTELENTFNLDLVNWIINNYEAGSTVTPKSYNVDWHSAHYPFPSTNFGSAVNTPLPVTWEDIQAAIWALMDNDVVYDSWRYLPNLTYRNEGQENAWGIIYAALTTPGAEGFTPGCDQKIAAILVPVDPQNPAQLITIQPIISYLQLPCETYDETGWADGYCGAPFGVGWATYFKWCKTSCP
ncbi:MAG: hypothetical protein JW917_00760 [Ignavibacteria bacterium]|nr:hypothetical protein [Ignavibacteria bacterium]